MEETYGDKKPRKSIRRLASSIQSLLGLKTTLTPTWAESVCQIIKSFSSTKQCGDLRILCQNVGTLDLSSDKKAETEFSLEKIQGDLGAINAKLGQLNLQRRQALNELLDLKGNIRVFCRIRPFLSGEKQSHLGTVVGSDSNNIILRIAENKRKQYNFDKVFNPQATQEEVFSEIEPVIKSALDGYNVCIFAYGQTGTGKTFTMEGTSESPGVVPRAIKELFDQVACSNHKFHLTFSMLEIYMGNLRDLLVPQRQKLTIRIPPPSLSIKTDPIGGIQIENLVAIDVYSFEQVKKLYRLGSRLRSTASTLSNATSSRSHSLIRITMSCSNAPERRREINKIWMVDLGGSERLLKTQAKGRRLEEGKAINLSLSALGDVISSLQTRKAHVPYRNSKLTQVLKDSLGGESKTLMLVHVSPREEDLCETVCTLGFATRVRSIHLGDEESKEVREVKEATLVELAKKVNHFESECQCARSEIQRLTKMLKLLDGSEILSNEHLRPPNLSDEDMQASKGVDEQNLKGTPQSSKKMPRFMRPTICSQQKIDPQQQIQGSAKKKPPVHPKKRKSSSVYAESLPQDEENNLQPEFSSECSISRTKSFEWKYNAMDDSEDALDCEIKTVIFPEQQKSSSCSFASDFSRSTTAYENNSVFKVDDNSFLSMENEIHLQTGEPSVYSHQSKKEAVDVPVENKLHSEGNKGVLNNEGGMIDYVDTKIIDPVSVPIDTSQDHPCNAICQRSSKGRVDEISTVKVASNKTVIDLMSSLMIENRHVGDQLDYMVENVRFIQEIQANQQLLNLASIEACNNQPYVVDQEGKEAPISDDNAAKENRSLNRFPDLEPPSKDITYPIPRLRSQRALTFKNDLSVVQQKKESLNEPRDLSSGPQEENQNRGTCCILRCAIQTICASVLLGLGLESLGLGHDFYTGLTF